MASVAYDDTYYIGEVLKIPVDEKKAEVNFMARSKMDIIHGLKGKMWPKVCNNNIFVGEGNWKWGRPCWIVIYEKTIDISID